MKRWFLAVILCSATIFPAARSGGAQTNTVLGTWRVAITGHDKGIAYLTFTNDFTMTGWGIKLKSSGIFTMAGTWDIDNNSQVMCSYTEESAGVPALGFFVGRVKGRNHLLVKANTTNGQFSFKSDNGIILPDLHGTTWIGEVKKSDIGYFETLTIATSTNELGMFILSGSGTGPGGINTVSGELLVDSQWQAYGYSIEQFEDGSSVTNSFGGRLDKLVDRGNFKGVDNKGHSLRFSITR
ncbi:MAG: hypothetical protein ABSC38_04720 [Verrucomicrobiia bacterium]